MSNGINLYQYTTSVFWDPQHGKNLYADESNHLLSGVPHPFTEVPGSQSGRRRQFSAESKYELDCIPDPFEEQHCNYPSKAKSQYVFESPDAHRARSFYAMDYHRPNSEVKNIPKVVSYHSPTSPTVNVRSSVLLPNSAYNYTAHSSPYPTHPIQWDYDYTSYSQPMMPTPYYAPSPFFPPYPASPHYYHQLSISSSGHKAPIPMYNLGIPYYLNNPMNAPFSSISSESGRDTEMDNVMIPDQFCASPQGAPLRRPTTPNNETINKCTREVDSVADLHKLYVHFEPGAPLSHVGSQESTSDRFRLRGFSLDSINNLKALPGFPSISLNNEPSKDVYTAKESSAKDFSHNLANVRTSQEISPIY